MGFWRFEILHEHPDAPLHSGALDQARWLVDHGYMESWEADSILAADLAVDYGTRDSDER